MQDSVSMEVLEALAHLNEKLPDPALRQGSTHLALEVKAKITVFTKLHDDVNFLLVQE